MLYTHNQKFVPSLEKDEFLPPISTWTSLAGALLLGTIGSAIALSSWIQYNVMVETAATIRPIGDTKLVQPEMEGTVEGIFVKENQIVKKGEVIARLDTRQLQIKKSQLQSNIEQSRVQVIQIDSQIAILDTQISAEKRFIERSVSSAKADLARNEREYQERKVSTQSELLVSEASLQKAKANLQKAQADLDFAQMDSDRYGQLAEMGAIGRREFEQKKLVVEQTKLIVESEKISIEIAKAKLQSAQAIVNPSMAKIAIAEERVSQEIARGEATIATLNKEKQALMQRLVEMQTQLKQYQKEVQQIETQLQNSIIRATSDGTILKLNLRNPGQVVGVSESIAEIVPQDAALVIKAMIPTAEIQKVAVGQKVQLRIDACPYPDYGTLEGVVTSISPDVIIPVDSKTNTGYFEATIQPKMLKFGNAKVQCHIQSGMNAKANIISQEETALQFILRKARLVTDI
ncbi:MULTISPECIES: HlyD family secretion protein [Nostoc]|uniref:HlyD family efflux transporter periplasmic adaptor subunit n=1 Tax=Nostoc paludosum FACHB-159 TaxID=2692908 RepID=A0ABR8KFL9_9NOSO|nr:MULTISPECIES: HlyD family efflux transporter periplasmic adaptor subunit [Nostoc]MBD2681040.1 HlyD family efflux transporter periplasmic adaptor subunit [Nostoc sp. FACHB-857]MBD2737514.1 HlyD family efflux transporter periplasmic adaptor subunit [Nostoc paludosum FACHB-159]